MEQPKASTNLNQILNSIKHEKELCYSSSANQIDTIVVQFTDWTRDDTTFENSVSRTIEHHVKQIKMLVMILEMINL